MIRGCVVRRNSSQVSQVNKELTEALLEQSENDFFHAQYEKELKFYSSVKSGKVELIKENFYPLSQNKDFGLLSDNPINNFRYHYIITVALVTRFCIEGGLPSETAYTLSDLYIRKVDKVHSVDAIDELHRQMILDYAERMKKICSLKKSKPISLAVEFINKNIRQPFSEEDIARAANVSPSYLSTLFKKETGETIISFIQRQKIEEAKNMLRFTETEYIDISNYLCFSSHSHFIAVFKKFTGMTPKEYRKKHFRTNWSGVDSVSDEDA